MDLEGEEEGEEEEGEEGRENVLVLTRSRRFYTEGKEGVREGEGEGEGEGEREREREEERVHMKETFFPVHRG